MRGKRRVWHCYVWAEVGNWIMICNTPCGEVWTEWKPNSFHGIWIHLGVGLCTSVCGIRALPVWTQVRPSRPAVSDVGTNNHKIQEGKSRHAFIFEAFLKDPRGMVCEKRAKCCRDLNRSAAVSFPRKPHQCASIQSWRHISGAAGLLTGLGGYQQR